MKRAIGMIAIAASALLMPVATLAQDSTPTTDGPRGVPAELCTIEPRTVESLRAIIERQPADGTDVRIPIRFAPGEGEPADVLTVEAITDVMNELAACYNAGDLLRIYGLFTDNALLPALLPEDIEAAASATPEPIAGSGLYEEPEIWDIRVQADGRVTAMVDFNDEVALITFAWNGERYLIDLFDDQIVGSATPAAGA